MVNMRDVAKEAIRVHTLVESGSGQEEPRMIVQVPEMAPEDW